MLATSNDEPHGPHDGTITAEALSERPSPALHIPDSSGPPIPLKEMYDQKTKMLCSRSDDDQSLYDLLDLTNEFCSLRYNDFEMGTVPLFSRTPEERDFVRSVCQKMSVSPSYSLSFPAASFLLASAVDLSYCSGPFKFR